MLTEIRDALRLTGDSADREILDLIEAAKKDLQESGVLKITESDALIKMAIQLYCKGNFGYENPEALRFLEKYESLKAHLSSAADYNAFKVTFTVTHDGVAAREAIISIDDSDGTYLITNSQGVAEYYVFAIQDVDYSVTYSGHLLESYVYVDSDESVAVIL